MSAAAEYPSDCSRAWAEIDLAALRANAEALAARLAPDAALMAVVKADAYGHGLLPAAREAIHGGARWLGVASVAEGQALRRDGIAAPIALLCAPPPADAPAIVAHELTPMLGDCELASALAAACGRRQVEVHLEIDTGMGRAGVLPEDAVALWRQCARDKLTVTGLCTHFADADGPTADMTLLQWNRFAEARAGLEAAGARFEWVHASNSAAAIRYSANGCNLARPGLLLYGLQPVLAEPLAPSPSPADPPHPQPLSLKGRGERMAPPLPPNAVREFWERGLGGERAVTPALPLTPGTLWVRVPAEAGVREYRERRIPARAGGGGEGAVRPVLSLKARVSAVRDLPAGHTVSYGATCRLARPTRAATVLIGYGDGYPRRLSNCGGVLIRGCRAPILGRVCMDQTIVDVTDIPGVSAGDIATCIGTDGPETIAAETIANLIETTEHEITTCLTSRLPRIYR